MDSACSMHQRYWEIHKLASAAKVVSQNIKVIVCVCVCVCV